MKIVSGKSKIILKESKCAAVRAVKIYNDVDDNYRIQAYISLLIMAYTKLFLSYFYRKIGDKYYYKKNGRYIYRDGKRQTWSLKDCIIEYEKREKSIEPAVKENIFYFIGLRNEIEHNYIDEMDLERIIFGELQSFLYNYNSLLKIIFDDNISRYLRMPLLVDFFNDEYRNIVSSSSNKIIKYIVNYKKNLTQEIQSSDCFSFKFIALPNVDNRATAPAITFLKHEDVTDQTVVSIKEKIIEKEVSNRGCMRPQKIVDLVLRENNNLKYRNGYSKYHAANIFNVIDIVKLKFGPTNRSLCTYDELSESYSYKPETKKILIWFFNNIPIEEMRAKNRLGEKIEIVNIDNILGTN